MELLARLVWMVDDDQFVLHAVGAVSVEQGHASWDSILGTTVNLDIHRTLIYGKRELRLKPRC